IAGLQDIAPTVANLWVTSAVLAPMRAAAAAASQPAWPPPITTTSNRLAIDDLRGRRCSEGTGTGQNDPFWANVSRETLGPGTLLPNATRRKKPTPAVSPTAPPGRRARAWSGVSHFSGQQLPAICCIAPQSPT